MTPGIFHRGIEKFLQDRGASHLDPVFDEMHALARQKMFPIVGPEVGRFFLQLARLRQPRRILELGSGFGYSSIWWALGAGKDVEIHTTEFDPANIALARGFAERFGVGDRVVSHEGDALEWARKLEGPWDIAFIDCDKNQYVEAFGILRPKMRRGDFLLYDNVLWHGRVASDEERRSDAATRVIVDLLDRAYEDAGLDVSILPIRDGVLLAAAK